MSRSRRSNHQPSAPSPGVPQRAQNAIGHTRILSLTTPPSLALQHRKGSVEAAPVRAVPHNPSPTDRLPHSVIPLGRHHTYGIRSPLVALPEDSPASQARAGPAASTTMGHHQDQHIDSDRHRSNRDRACPSHQVPAGHHHDKHATGNCTDVHKHATGNCTDVLVVGLSLRAGPRLRSLRASGRWAHSVGYEPVEATAEACRVSTF